MSNAGDWGGAVHFDRGVGGSLLCIGCLFRQNVSGGISFGGAVSGDGGTLTFVNTHFLGNRSRYGGGAISSREGSVVRLYNVALVGNRSGLEDGGALYSFSGGPFEAVGLTAYGNQSGDQGERPGAVIWARWGGNFFHNAVLWGNRGTRLAAGLGAVEVRRAIVEEGCAVPMTCEDIIDTGPLFAREPSPGPDNQWATGDDDYGDLRLQGGSPGLDFGLASLLPPDRWDLDADGDTLEALPVDMNSGPRVEGSEVDLGPYEGEANVANEPEPPASPLTLAVAPNPARGAAAVTLTLARAARVEVAVYDALGRRVAWLRDGVLAAGPHRFTLDRAGLPPGVYFVRAQG
ncbi:MAG TPA: T9SS type A sorting domain-containing protein, partial [Rubricoccaceae bacterium]|nr:T9SS type A sorting domain-containing protein [Rubricoccaceae bacterium]